MNGKGRNRNGRSVENGRGEMDKKVKQWYPREERRIGARQRICWDVEFNRVCEKETWQRVVIIYMYKYILKINKTRDDLHSDLGLQCEILILKKLNILYIAIIGYYNY